MARYEEDSRELSREWYVIHTYSGYENKVKMNLERKIASQGLENEIFNVVVPLEDEIEKKDDKERVVKRKIFPGYVLVDMIRTNRAWYVVRNTQGVTGFVGTEKDPVALSPDEVKRIFASMEAPPKPARKDFAEGDTVRITDGMFKGSVGKVTDADSDGQRAKVDVNGMILDLEFDVMEKG